MGPIWLLFFAIRQIEVQVLDKIPPSDLLAPLYVWILSFMGAAVGYLEDFKLEDGWKVWLLKALTKGCSSSLAAILTYHALQAIEVTNENWRIVLIGVAAHMGTEALKALGEVWKARVK